MSRISRGHVYNDNEENIKPIGTNFGGKVGAGKGLSSRQAVRTALGDISNRGGAERLGKGSFGVDKWSKKDNVEKTGRAVTRASSQTFYEDENLPLASLRNSKPKRTGLPDIHRQPQDISKSTLNQSRNTKELDDVKMSLNEDMECSLTEDIKNLSVCSVDAADTEDPQAVTEFVKDIFTYFKRIEGRRAPCPTYIANQTDINARMREILIDWMIEVHLKFKLRDETLYLTVNIIDRFLERQQVSRTKLQLVGCTAMLLASKYEEIYAPEIRDFVYISDRAYTRDQILEMESLILNTLKFNLTVPSILRFGERFARISRGGEKAEMLTKFLMELTLQEYEFMNYLPSQIAGSAVYLALKSVHGAETDWSANLQEISQYSEAALRPCITALYKLATQSEAKYTAVRRKYGKKDMSVSKMSIYRPNFVRD